MGDGRQALNAGYVLCHGSMRIEIKEELGRGGNSIVYLGEYPDSVMNGKLHRCIIKELFPYHQKGMVFRAADGSVVAEDREFGEIHKRSFIRGNGIHLDTLYKNPDITESNIDSFETNNTMYTILGFDGAVSLSRGTKTFATLKDAVRFMTQLLDLVEPFHNNNMLHLDISPDNIIVSETSGRLMLIDFNGSVDMSEGVQSEYFSINPNYAPPELKLGRQNSLSAATDIFSVCAVMVYIITGKSFDYVGTNVKNLQKEKIVKDAPSTAKQYLTYILAKGLRANPKLRFQSASELRDALGELTARIDGAGMTHAALWEISKRLCKPPEDNLIENQISVNGVRMSAENITSLKTALMGAAGGMGKTTLFKRLVYDNTRRYNARLPVMFYVPLYDYDGKRDFIKRYIASKVRYNENTSTVNEAIKQFTCLADGTEGFIYLLLDGFNEISCDSANLIREIKELCAKKGVGAAISSRTAAALKELSGFDLTELLPIDDAGIKRYLTARAVACPEDEGLMKLLGNPLMLTLYAKTAETMRSTDKAVPQPVTQDDIMEGYIDSLCAAKKSAPLRDENEIERFEYVTEHLLPAICAKLKNGGELSYAKMRQICAADFKRLRSRAFSKAFPKYAGSSKAILHGVKTPDEWLETAVNKILADETALIVRNNGKYHAMHMNLAEFEAKRRRANKRRYNRAALAQKTPKTLALVFCICVAAYAGVYFAPHTHPLGKEETQKNTEAVNLVLTHLLKAYNMTSHERSVIGAMESGSREDAAAILSDASEVIAVMDYRTFTDCAEYAFRGLDDERINKIGDLVSEHYDFWLDFSQRLESALRSDSRYTDEYIIAAAKDYEDYLDAFERRIGYEMYLSFAALKDSADDVLLKGLTSFGAFSDAYADAAGWGVDVTKQKINETESELNEALLALDVIRK